MNPPSPVLAPLASLAEARRRHARGIAIAGIIAAVVAVAGFVALLDTWLEWKSPVRIGLVAIIATASLILLVKRLRLSKRHDPAEAARVIEEAHPEIGQKLRTALEVSARPAPADADGAFFTDRLMRETGRDLLAAPWSKLVPSKQLWTKRATAMAALAVIAIVAVMWGDFRHALKRIVLPHRDLTYTLVEWKSLPKGFDETHPPRLEFVIAGRQAQPELLVRQGKNGDWKPVELTRREDGRTWDIVFTGKTTDLQVKVLAGDAVVEEKTIAYRPIPKLVESKAVVAYPEYTGLEAETVPGGDVRCVEGSNSTWDFTFNAPPSRVTWTVAGGPPVELTAKTGSTFTVSTEIKAGKAQGELAIYHADGERLDAWRFEVDGIVDKLPVVEIVEPIKDLELISSAEMPVRIRAKDDFGIAEIGLILDAGGERRWVVETTYDKKNERQVSELAAMMLDQIPLKITDNVRIHAYALDHKPRGGPRAVSPLRSVDIRQFQIRWFNGGEMPPGGEPPPDAEALSDALMKLDKIISTQRGILSDVFQTKESFRATLTPEALTKTGESATRQQELASETQRVAMAWENAGDLPADDVALMSAAGIQMAEAAGFLEAPDLAKGFTTGDRALSSLLQLRKEFIKVLCKCKDPGEPEKSPPAALADLAKEARRIAAEEKDVAGKVAPESIEANNITATRRQQEVALADTGELYAKLVDHHERTEGAMRLMDDAEKAVAKAEKTLRSEAPGNASPELRTAEQDLLDFATFIEALDLQKLSETLRKLADNAEKNSKEQEKGDKPAESPGEKPGEKPGESPAQAQAQGQSKGQGKGEGQSQGEGEGKSPEQATASNEDKGEGQGKGEQQKPTPAAGQQQGQAAADAAQATDLANKILEELAKKANSGQEQGPEAPKSPSAAALEALKQNTDVAKLAKDLEALSKAQKEGQGKGTAEEQAKLAERLGQMARDFRDAAASLDASLLAELNKAQEQAAELKKELAKQGEGKKPGEGKGEGEKPGEDGKGAVAAKEGEGQGKGDKPGEKGEGDKPGEGQGQGKDDKPGEGQGQGQAEIASKDGKGEGGTGDKPGDNMGGAGKIENAGPGGAALGRFADTLERIRDEDGLGRMVIPLRASAFDRSAIPLVENADQRIQELIGRIPTDAGIVSARGKLPEESRREIEDYFRDLSDDFGGEVWEKKQ